MHESNSQRYPVTTSRVCVSYHVYIYQTDERILAHIARAVPAPALQQGLQCFGIGIEGIKQTDIASI